MRLINVNTYEFREFYGRQRPRYAILSHTWGNGELSHADWEHIGAGGSDKRRLIKQPGYKKIYEFLHLVRQFEGAWESREEPKKLSWAWVDTICIDKKSSAELTEAINSMWHYYEDSTICFAYLKDVPADDDIEAPNSAFRTSRWWQRGWTLQELIAPERVIFYSADWKDLGDKRDWVNVITDITGIPIVVAMSWPFQRGDYLVAEKMSWASKRRVTRREDIAYCLLGLFGINMPLLYGEGKRAFTRLQEEIIRRHHDHSIFTWTTAGRGNTQIFSPVLDTSPSTFRGLPEGTEKLPGSATDRRPFATTNLGLQIELPILRTGVSEIGGRVCKDDACACVIALLDLIIPDEISPARDQCVCIFLEERQGQYVRTHSDRILQLSAETVEKNFSVVNKGGIRTFTNELIYCRLI